MKKLMFFYLLVIPFCKAADFEVIQLVGKDKVIVSIDANLYTHSGLLKDLVKDCPIIDGPIPCDNFDHAQLKQLYNLLLFAKDSGAQDDLLSKEYETMLPEEIEQNEGAIINLVSNFKDKFFPGKDELTVEDQSGKLTDLYEIVSFFTVCPALTAIVELRAQPEGAFKLELLEQEGEYPDIPGDLQDLMAKRIEQRYLNGNFACMIVRSPLGPRLLSFSNIFHTIGFKCSDTSCLSEGRGPIEKCCCHAIPCLMDRTFIFKVDAFWNNSPAESKACKSGEFGKGANFNGNLVSTLNFVDRTREVIIFNEK